MLLSIINHTFQFEIENVCRLFFPLEKIMVTDFVGIDPEQVSAVAALEEDIITCRVVSGDFDETLTAAAPLGRDDCEREMAALLYRLLVKLTERTQPWGIVTGVRPVKMMRRLDAEIGRDAADVYFRDKLLVSEKKTHLCRCTLSAEDTILSLSRPDSFSLYIAVPFCPTRCDYCSFVSHTIATAGKLIPDYVKYLIREIQYTGGIAHELGLRLETIYFGGGTPTSLSAEQLTALFDAVAESFDLSHLREYTVEAGRPDTVTREKLAAIRAAGDAAGLPIRISINPQSLQDSVLTAIGRRHTAGEFFDAFSLAREMGFDHINTDLIAGLPEDDLTGFTDTLEKIIGLAPENVTVHTLAMKRASVLSTEGRGDFSRHDECTAMLDTAVETLTSAGYHPYYLYRQSKTVASGENVGWAKPGQDGLYNVYMMDETHTVLGCGAGAVTKLKQPNGVRLERVFNYKYPYEYNARFDEMIKRKAQIWEFYGNIV